MTDPATENQKLLGELLSRISQKPTASDLWSLRGTLLTRLQEQPGRPDARLIKDVVRDFYLYLSELQSKLTARQYNELASRLDIGSVGTLALQDILVEQENLWKNLLLGGIGEGLMVLASRQYIKAWEQELKSTHRRAAWDLYEALWQLSHQFQADMPADERRALIEALLAPALKDDTPLETKMLLLLRLFQVALLILVAPLCVSVDIE